MVILSFSDSDGLFDHVPPYTGDSYGPGGRVPTVVISPDTAGGKINSQPYETASWLRMLGTRYSLNTDSLFMNQARLQSTNDFTNIFTDVTTNVPIPATLTASLCMLFYSLPGNPDFPWSSAVQLTLQYTNATVVTSSGSAVQIVSGSGTRTFTNKFGKSTTVTVSCHCGARWFNLGRYQRQPAATSAARCRSTTSGITLAPCPLNQVLPGHGPSVAYSQLALLLHRLPRLTSLPPARPTTTSPPTSRRTHRLVSTPPAQPSCLP